MKIAYFIGTLKKEDGVGIVLMNMIREANAKGHTCIVVTGWAEDATMVAAPVVEVPSVVLPIYTDYKIPLPGMKGFEKELDAFAPDVIHVHSPDPVAWAALKYAQKNHIPILATHHSDFARYLSYFHIASFEPIVWSVLEKLYKQMALVTAPSAQTVQDLTDNDIPNAIEIPWGVDETRFDPSFRSESWREEILGTTGTHVVLCICRLIWYKDLRVLADAYGILKQKRNDFAMVIAGDGPARHELETLMPGALFLGHIEGKRLSEVYASTDVLLFPSRTETFGNVTVESLSSGVVPVVANAGGSRSLVQDRVNGFCVSPGDAGAFAQKVETLFDDATLYTKMRNAGLASAKNYAWPSVFQKFETLYKQCIENNTGN